MMTECDVAILGAGITGLTIAQSLKKAGYSVTVLEKSRGVGGRCATRRVAGERVDHGVRYLEPTTEAVQSLITQLKVNTDLKLWLDTVYEMRSNQLLPQTPSMPRYVTSNGMNAVGKFLAEGLEIQFSRRVTHLTVTPEKRWQLTLDVPNDRPQFLQAKSVVIAIPAPQALMLLEPLSSQIPADFLKAVHSVDYHACITVMAGYPREKQAELSARNPAWQAVTFPEDEILDWVGLDSSKREHSQAPIVVTQSSPKFAQQHLETTDLESVGQTLLNQTATSLMPWLNQPEWMQVHRWRYAFCRTPLATPYLSAKIPLPLVCAGDWCGGNQIEGALISGKAAAEWMIHLF